MSILRLPPTAPASPGRTPGPATADLEGHLDDHQRVIDALRAHLPVLREWGEELAARLLRGQRLIALGNGGSAAEAQHLTAEIVGRFDGERRPFSALALHAETSSVTAIANDYGYDDVYARQVMAHARVRDVVVLFSTSGRSENLLRAARAARTVGAATWALTGPGPNPLCDACDAHIALPGPSAGVQEAHLAALHLLCRVFDERVRAHDQERMRARGAAGGVPR
ncbi:SIS domain-containing protein [Microbacterium sp. LRZ72]|uniref:D-sedoheptulose-7-phosphate isomerase n=1 Tax=Microbacterium sp. LRZ72 TaxID=2942481 RepID=UPI0029AEF143|nr:SIS domain-containing protein [Microbacterium sp. LRZ72]MDX2376733.1 SIS domain-containing protein [Microbacterium sp. LRZ72]